MKITSFFQFENHQSSHLLPMHTMMEELCGEPQYAYIQYSDDPQEGLRLVRFGKQTEQTCQETQQESPTQQAARIFSSLTEQTCQETRQESQTFSSQTQQTCQETRQTIPLLTQQESQTFSSQTQQTCQETRPSLTQQESPTLSSQTQQTCQSAMNETQEEVHEEPKQGLLYYYNKQPMQYYQQQPMQYYQQQPMQYYQQPTRLLNVVEPSSRLQSQSDYLFAQLQKQHHKCHYFQELSLKQEREIQSLKELSLKQEREIQSSKDKLQLSDRNIQQLRGVLMGRIKYTESLKK